jgi:alkyl hydroperoxide reductase subunit AhpC
VTIEFPIIADETREVAVKYGMIDPELKDKVGRLAGMAVRWG